MPFADDFDEIYTLFIKSTLETAGYIVRRSDDILSQQNILKDVVRGIADAELIVADLTGANPNVYYELGLAHALGKRVILLTQATAELPFDLKAYRVISYDTHFAHIEEARGSLLDIAKEALGHKLEFGNPVSDFLPEDSKLVPVQPSVPPASEVLPSESEPGLLDQLVAIEEGFENLATLVGEISSGTQHIGASTIEATGHLNRIMSGPRPQAREARAVIVGLAQKLQSYGLLLEERNAQYAAMVLNLRNALESMIAAQQPRSEKERTALSGFLQILDDTRENTVAARAAIGSLAEAILSAPRLERTFNQAADFVARNVERYAENLDQTASMIVRAIEVGKSKLDSTGGPISR